MSETMETKMAKRRERSVPVLLRGATVMESFRDNLFDASNRAGMTANEYVLQATAEKLKAAGRPVSGLFSTGDIEKRSH